LKPYVGGIDNVGLSGIAYEAAPEAGAIGAGCAALASLAARARRRTRH
jgi:hypothetical protein